jgi:hypothetical protein
MRDPAGGSFWIGKFSTAASDFEIRKPVGRKARFVVGWAEKKDVACSVRGDTWMYTCSPVVLAMAGIAT